MNNCHVRLKQVDLTFRIYRDKAPSLKHSIIDWLRRQSIQDRYQDINALSQVDIEIREGERVGILGLNGAGKSTLLKTIAGIYKPQRGAIEVRGQVVPLLEVGTGFNPEFSGRENIYLNGSMLAYPRSLLRKLEPTIIEFSGVSDMIDVPLKYYSSGMQARLAFSIACCIDPEILIMDEIFATGDAHFINKARARLQQMVGTSRIAIVVSHDLHIIKDLCTRVLIMNKGKLIADGPTEKMIEFYLQEQIGTQNFPETPH